jgi:hypothetical protein
MHVVRTAVMTAGLVVLPSAALAQTTTTTRPTATTTTATSTTTTTVVNRVDDLVCAEPVNQVAICVDPQGRIVTRVEDPRQTTTTVPQLRQQPLQVQPHGDVVEPEPAPPTVGRQVALTG